MVDNSTARIRRRTGRTRVLAGAVAGLVAAAGLSMVPVGGASADPTPGVTVAPMPGSAAVSLAQAGELTMWGPYATTLGGINNDIVFGADGQTTVPASLAGVAVTQVAAGDSFTLALTAAGQVVGFGGGENRLERIPAAVQAEKIAQITTRAGHYAGAVTRDGRVLVWGPKYAAPTAWDIPAGLTGVKQLGLTWQGAVALKNDGTVVTWGYWGFGTPAESAVLRTPPAGLTATAIAAGYDTAYALTTSGTVVAWGANSAGQLNLPAEVTQPGNVRAVVAYEQGAIALLANNTLVAWGGTTIPDWVSEGIDCDVDEPANAECTDVAPLGPVVSIVGNGTSVGVVDDDGVLHHWAADYHSRKPVAVPAELAGRPIADLAVGYNYVWGGALVTKMLRAEDPTITGTPAVGSTLTATPGTFSASPTSVTGQWLVNGAPIPGATGTTLPLTAAQVGKQITYQSTATKAGETTISSTSAALTVPGATSPQPGTPQTSPVSSTTQVLKVTVAKKAASLTATGKVTATKPVTGKATITIKMGKTTILAKPVTVPATGAVKLTVKKFGKLVLKKTKSKKKAGYRGKYTLTIAYAGNTNVKASTATKTFTVK